MIYFTRSLNFKMWDDVGSMEYCVQSVVQPVNKRSIYSIARFVLELLQNFEGS